jgi:hypothetical protein
MGKAISHSKRVFSDDQHAVDLSTDFTNEQGWFGESIGLVRESGFQSSTIISSSATPPVRGSNSTL